MDPRAHARAARQLAAGLEERDGRIVIDGLGVHAAEDADLVGDVRGVRQQVAEPGAALAVLVEIVHASGTTGKRSCCATMPVTRWPPKTEAGMSWLNRSLHLGLVVEQVEVRRAAGLEQEDDAFRLRREVRERRRRHTAGSARATRRERRPAPRP